MTLVVVEPLAAFAAMVVALAILVLPGSNVGWLVKARTWDPVRFFIVSFVLSVAGIVAVGSTLIAFQAFTAGLMGVLTAIAAIAGAVPAVRVLRAAARDRARAGFLAIGSLLVAALAIPWVVFALQPGVPRSSTYQWYYWTVAQSLSDVHGVPASVLEYGQAIRWLPDYVGFNIVSEAYRGLLDWAVTDTTLISAFRVAPVVLAIVLAYACLRLWLGRAASIVAVGSLLVTVFFVSKFNVYKPESLGIALGFAALWAVTGGVRHGRPGLVILSGIAIGLAMAAHAIAATAFAIAMVGAGSAEWLAIRRHRWRAAGWLVAGGVSALVVVGMLGWSIQGRPFVASDALRPELVDGVDPTWVYLNHSIGIFDVPPVPSLREQLAPGALAPWPGVSIRNANTWWLYGAIGFGIALAAWFGRRDTRVGLLGGAATTALLVGVMMYFALSFETYVPRHTGLARFGQYLPLLFAFGVGFAVEGFVRAIGVVAQRPTPDVALAVVAALVVLVWAPADVADRYRSDNRFGPEGDLALAQLQQIGEPGDVVITNVVASGWLEFFGSAEAPFEGRQPLIEDVELLAAVNQLLVDLHVFLEDPDDEAAAAAIAGLSPRWFVVTDEPSGFGTDQTFGGSVERFAADPAFRSVWTSGDTAIFEAVDRPPPVAADTRALELWWRWLVSLAVMAAVIGGSIVLTGAWRPAIRRRPVPASGYVPPAPP